MVISQFLLPLYARPKPSNAHPTTRMKTTIEVLAVARQAIHSVDLFTIRKIPMKNKNNPDIATINIRHLKGGNHDYYKVSLYGVNTHCIVW